jgi:hypothetical protein
MSLYKLKITKGKEVRETRTVNLAPWLADGWKVDSESCEEMPKDRKVLINKMIEATAKPAK